MSRGRYVKGDPRFTCSNGHPVLPGERWCLQCGQPPVDASLVAEGETEEVLRPFNTNNPYLQKLFSMKEFGQAPGSALTLLREVSPDPHEQLLCAVRSQHGPLKFGYLVATTHYLRWIQTLPLRTDDFWSYANPLDVHGQVIMVPGGLLFQTRAARKFGAIYRIAQQAWNWETAHADDEALAVVTSDWKGSAGDLAGQLERLAQLLDRGLLTPDEFSQAKAKLLSQPAE